MKSRKHQIIVYECGTTFYILCAKLTVFYCPYVFIISAGVLKTTLISKTTLIKEQRKFVHDHAMNILE